jgi:integrase
MPEGVASALIHHRDEQRPLDRALAAGRWKETGYVFTTVIGTPIDGTNLTAQGFKRLLKRAGLPDMRFHDLRHTCASLLIAEGRSPREIMGVLGHSQISLTMDTYGHLFPENQHRAADAMQRALFDEEEPS